MRVLINRESDMRSDDLDNEQLDAIYMPPREPWFRANMVSTVDGAATGDTGTTGSINNEPDKRVFDVLRRQADAVVVGAGTVRIEGYRPADRPLVVVSRRGALPLKLMEAPRGSVLLATCAAAEGLEVTRDALGAENVLELGTASVDLPTFKKALLERGTHPPSHRRRSTPPPDLLAAARMDELCATVVPRLVAGRHLRILEGGSHDASLTLRVLLLEQDSTVLGRWFT